MRFHLAFRKIQGNFINLAKSSAESVNDRRERRFDDSDASVEGYRIDCRNCTLQLPCE
jgi:hypothetical protein